MRFGIGMDFFVNVILTILGYIPGHLHNFFIQRVRDNSNKKRTPSWLLKYGLVVNPRNTRGNTTKWADRYLYVPEFVQHDEEGRAYYLNPETDEFDAPAAPRFGPRVPEEEEEVVQNGSELVEPDRYFASKKPSSYYNQDTPTTAGSSDAWRAPPKSFKARTLKLFGGGTSSAPSMDRHSRIDHAMGDPVHQRRNNIGYHAYDDQEESVDEPYTRPSTKPSSAPTDTLDELDRELMGLSTQEQVPPVRASRQAGSGAYKPRARAPPPPPAEERSSATRTDAPVRDVMEFEHTF